MGKKCIICDAEAVFVVKGTSEYYCQGCAEEHFDDLSYLKRIDDIESEEAPEDEAEDLKEA